MAIIYNTSIVRTGLVLYLDAANPRSYPGSGSILYDISPLKNNASLIGTYSFSNGTIRLNNSSNDMNLNISHVQSNTILNITTVSLWFRVESYSTTRYLLDMRTGGGNGWIYNGGPGADWSSGTLFVNGSSAQTVTWGNIEPPIGSWRNVTVIANTPASDDINFFSRFSDTEGYDVTFGAIMVYNRSISEQENRQNFNAIRDRFGV